MAHRYKINILDAQKRISFAHAILSSDDETAEAQAEALADQSSFELWDGGRLVTYHFRHV